VSESARTLARRLVKAQEDTERAKNLAKQLEAAAKDAQEAFWDRMDDEGDTTRTMDLGEPYGKVQFVKRETPRARVLSKDVARAAIREAGLDEALLEDAAIRQAALNDYVREWLRSGEPLPAGIDVSFSRYVTITRK
jgi:hypothetical protein